MSMLAILEMHNERLVLAGLTTTGLSLFNVELKPGKLSAESKFQLPDGITLRQLLKELVLVYGTLEDIRKLLLLPWHIEEVGFEEGIVRKIKFGGQLKVKIRYDNKQEKDSRVERFGPQGSSQGSYLVEHLQSSSI